MHRGPELLRTWLGENAGHVEQKQQEHSSTAQRGALLAAPEGAEEKRKQQADLLKCEQLLKEL